MIRRVIVLSVLMALCASVTAEIPCANPYTNTAPSFFPFLETGGIDAHITSEDTAPVLIMPRCKGVLMGKGESSSLVRVYLPVVRASYGTLTVTMNAYTNGTVKHVTWTRVISNTTPETRRIVWLSTLLDFADESSFEMFGSFNGTSIEIEQPYICAFGAPRYYGAVNKECASAGCVANISNGAGLNGEIVIAVVYEHASDVGAVLLDSERLETLHGDDGTVFVHAHNVPSGVHSISVLFERASRIQIQAITLPVKYGITVRNGAINADSDLLTPMIEQPRGWSLLDRTNPDTGLCPATSSANTTLYAQCGQWTKLATIEVPPLQNKNNRCCNWIQSGIVELERGGNWLGEWCQIGIENDAHKNPADNNACDSVAEFGLLSFNGTESVVSFFSSGFLYGNEFGNTLTVWIRKVQTATTNPGEIIVKNFRYDLTMIDDAVSPSNERRRAVTK